MDTTEQAINILIQQVIEAVHPLRIILFGSAASGKMTPRSDIDILIVMPEGTHRRRTAQSLYSQIHGVGTPFDLIVATPSLLEHHKENIGLIYHRILQEGREIYAA